MSGGREARRWAGRVLLQGKGRCVGQVTRGKKAGEGKHHVHRNNNNNAAM